VYINEGVSPLSDRKDRGVSPLSDRKDRGISPLSDRKDRGLTPSLLYTTHGVASGPKLTQAEAKSCIRCNPSQIV